MKALKSAPWKGLCGLVGLLGKVTTEVRLRLFTELVGGWLFLIQRLIHTRLSLIVSCWSGVFRLRFVHQIAIHFDPADKEQSAFEACAGLTFLLAFLIGECISPHVADTERNEHFLTGFNSLLAAFDEGFCFGADCVAVNVGVFGVVCRTTKGCNSYRPEGFAFTTRLHFADAVEITDASGVQVEEFGFVGLIAH